MALTACSRSERHAAIPWLILLRATCRVTMDCRMTGPTTNGPEPKPGQGHPGPRRGSHTVRFHPQVEPCQKQIRGSGLKNRLLLKRVTLLYGTRTGIRDVLFRRDASASASASASATASRFRPRLKFDVRRVANGTSSSLSDLQDQVFKKKEGVCGGAKDGFRSFMVPIQYNQFR